MLFRPPAQHVLRQIYATAACLEFLKLSQIETRSQQARDSINSATRAGNVAAGWVAALGGPRPWTTIHTARAICGESCQHACLRVRDLCALLDGSLGRSVCLSVRLLVCLSADDTRLASQGSTAVISWFSLETVALA